MKDQVVRTTLHHRQLRKRVKDAERRRPAAETTPPTPRRDWDRRSTTGRVVEFE